MVPSQLDPLELGLHECAQVGADLAVYCDHVEHNEVVDAKVLQEAGRRLRSLAIVLAVEFQLSLLDLYQQRLTGVEKSSVLADEHSSEPVQLVWPTLTWRTLQLIQQRHDRTYHPDVFGLSKLEQLRHYTLHVAKLTGHLSRVLDEETRDWTSFVNHRIPDILIFGIKLATVAGEHLPDDQDSALRHFIAFHDEYIYRASEQPSVM